MILVLFFVALLGLITSGPVSASNARSETCAQMYTVRRGDSLAQIARRFGVSVSELQSWNEIRNVNRIYVGQQLCVQSGASPHPDASSAEAVMALANMNVRSGPGIGHLIVDRLPQGQVARVVGEDAGWWKILCPSSTTGACWVSGNPRYTQPVAWQTDQPHTILPTQVTTVSVVPDAVPLYAGPGSDYEQVGSMFGGLPIPVNGISVDGLWWHAHCPDAPTDSDCDYWVSRDPGSTVPITFP